jgi:hypothetical protein
MVAFKRDGAPRSRPASTRPKHNHSAAAVLIFQGWYRANKLHPFPDAAAKAQMSADTGAVSVSVIRVCAPHAYHMQHLVVARACVSLCHAALPVCIIIVVFGAIARLPSKSQKISRQSLMSLTILIVISYCLKSLKIFYDYGRVSEDIL